MTRIRALVGKEFLDLMRNGTALLPVAVVTVLSLVLPFVVIIGIPMMSGRPLDDDPSLLRLSGVAAANADLTPEGQIQLFLFQQFLLLFLMTPITGAMALAAHSVVGEKQARTLEPLLATPISTIELLVAKVIGALVPTLAISVTGILVYFGGVLALGAPGVARAMASPRTFMLIGVLGPAAALVALQAAIVVSSRVNDPRTAQQFGVLLIIPLTALLIAQFMGKVWLSAAAMGLMAIGLVGVWILLTLVSAAVFDRETILTRWR